MPAAISTASVQQGEPVMLEQSGGWLLVALDAQALSTDSPSMENEAIRGTANVVPAITFLRNSRRLASTLLRISSGAIVASLVFSGRCGIASGRVPPAGSDPRQSS